MAASLGPSPVASSTLVDGSDLRVRVERLLSPAETERGGRLGWLPAIVLVATAVLLLSTPAGVGLHELFELLVRKGG
jgi:hypothetical protein